MQVPSHRVIPLLLLAACTSGGPAIQLVDGCLDLPAGTVASEVITSAGEAPVEGDCFTVPAAAADRMLALALAADGTPMLAGWLGDGHSTLSARSTADVFAFYGAGATTLPTDLQATALDLLEADGSLDAVADSISDALTADARAFAAPVPAVSAALDKAVRALLEREPDGTARAVLINPAGEQSGVTITSTEGINQIAFMNRYRRRAMAFVDRVSTFDSDGHETPSPQALPRVEVGAVQGLSGAVGTFNQIITASVQPGGLENSEDVAYVPRTSGPVDVPNVNDAKKTRYRVALVGPGATPGALDELTAEEVEAQVTLTRKVVVQDLVLPMIIQMLVPSSEADTYLKSPIAADLVQDLLNLITTNAPAVWDRSAQGDLAGAASVAFDTFVSSGAFRDLVLDAVLERFYDLRTAAGDAAYGRAGKLASGFIKVSGAVDTLTTAFDTTAVGGSIGLSHMADTWTVDVIDALVRLDPVRSRLGTNEDTTLTANVVDAGDDAVFEYRFSTTGDFGIVTNGISRGTEVTSSSPVITYLSGDDEGTDTVTVEVFEIDLSNRIRVGSATAEVEVSDSCDRTPQIATFTRGERVFDSAVPLVPPAQEWVALYGFVFNRVPGAVGYEMSSDLIPPAHEPGVPFGTHEITPLDPNDTSLSRMLSHYMTAAELEDVDVMPGANACLSVAVGGNQYFYYAHVFRNSIVIGDAEQQRSLWDEPVNRQADEFAALTVTVTALCE